jgi:hypothetical protein
LSSVGQTAAVNLDYSLGLNFFASESQNNYLGHTAALNGSYAVSPRLSFRLREYFIRSDDTVERQYLAGTQSTGFQLAANRGRSIFWRNVLEPEVEYRLGPESLIGLFVRDNVYRNESGFIEDSREDFVNPRLTYWFNMNHGSYVEYGFLRGDFDRQPDLDGHMVRGRYMYRPAPGKVFFLEHRFLKRTFDVSASDYDIHNPSIGTEYDLSPTLSARLQIGYYRFESEPSTSDGSTGEVSILKRLIDTSVALSARWGFYESYFTAENLGYSKFYGLYGNVTHRLSPKTTLGADAAMEWVDYRSDRTDRIMTVAGTITHNPFRWLSIIFEASHRQNDASDSAFEYKENRIMLRFTAIYI